MKKIAVALVLALMAATASPVLACGHSGAYRSAQAAKKPQPVTTAKPKDDPAPTTGVSMPDGFMPESARLSDPSSSA